MRYAHRIAWIVIVISVSAATRGRAQEAPVCESQSAGTAQLTK